MRTSAAIAPLLVANTGFRSISEISGKSEISCDTFSINVASASRLTGSEPRTPFSISAACDAVEHRQRIVACVAGASRNVMSFITSTSTPPRPNATSLPNDGIGDGADDHLLAAGQHLLHLHAEQVRLGVVLLRVGHDRRERRFRVLARS